VPADVTNPLMQLTEDIVIFEQQGKVRLQPAQPTTAEAVYADVLRPRNDGSASKPVCSWSKPVPLDRGRWVRIPAPHLRACMLPMASFASGNHNGQLLPPINESEPILCSSRHLMERIPGRHYYFSWGEFDAWRPATNGRQLHVWRSELSDSYSVEGNKAMQPHIAGPLAVQWVLPADVDCRLAPWREPAELRACFTDKKITRIVGMGASLMEWAMGATAQILRAAFANKVAYNMKFNHVISLGNGLEDIAQGRFFFVTNMRAPHFVGRPIAELRRDLEAYAKEVDRFAQGAVRKVYFTPMFSAYERWAGQHFGEFAAIAALMRELLPRDKGWIEVDYTAISRTFLFDATPEMDTLHQTGPALNTLAHLLLDALCQD